MSDQKKGVAVVTMCMDDRHKGDFVKEAVRARFPELERVFILTSPGGNYSLDYPVAIQTILAAGYEVSVVILGKHKACDCAAASAGLRVDRKTAHQLISEENERQGVAPECYVANICTHTSEFTKLERVNEDQLPQLAGVK